MLAIGIDVGGTSIKGAAVDSYGKVYEVFSMITKKEEPGEKVVIELCNLIKKYLSEQKFEEPILGVGVGIPGVINTDEGIVSYSANLPLWENLHVKDIMEKELGLPVRITNDANAAAFGEAKFGAGKDYPTTVMLTLGTGVGGGVVLNGELFEGNQGKGTELGHITLVLNGRDCGCGRKGCFEQYASATGLIADATSSMRKHPDSLMNVVAKELGCVDARVPFIAEKRGDRFAHEVVENYIIYLGEGLLNYCNIFRPNMIILSGGVANEGEAFLARLNQYLLDHDFGYKRTPNVLLAIAKLGYNSGKIGAAALFFGK